MCPVFCFNVDFLVGKHHDVEVDRSFLGSNVHLSCALYSFLSVISIEGYHLLYLDSVKARKSDHFVVKQPCQTIPDH